MPPYANGPAIMHPMIPLPIPVSRYVSYNKHQAKYEHGQRQQQQQKQKQEKQQQQPYNDANQRSRYKHTDTRSRTLRGLGEAFKKNLNFKWANKNQRGRERKSAGEREIKEREIRAESIKSIFYHLARF